jgi:hypothetical protein
MAQSQLLFVDSARFSGQAKTFEFSIAVLRSARVAVVTVASKSRDLAQNRKTVPIGTQVVLGS